MSNRFDQNTVQVTINDANLKISGATLRNLALAQLQSYPQCVAFIGQLVHVSKQLTLSGNEEAIIELFTTWRKICASEGLMLKGGTPSKEMSEALSQLNANETITAFYNTIKSHGRYVDILFVMSSSVLRQRLYSLFANNDPFSSDPWLEFFQSLNHAQQVSKQLAMEFMNRTRTEPE